MAEMPPGPSRPRQKSKPVVVAKLSDSQVGVPGLPVELPYPTLCPQSENVFEWHVQSFISQVELGDEKRASLCDVITDVQYELQKVIPHCKVLIFGSCSTSLAFQNSDVDLFLECVGEPPANFVRKHAKILTRSHKFAGLYSIAKAKVPIARFTHIQTKLKVDLNCTSKMGVYNSRLIRLFIGLDTRAKPLIFILKYWSKVYEIGSEQKSAASIQSLSSYSLVMLIIFYLQQQRIFPSVSFLQHSGWMHKSCDEEWTVQSKCSQTTNSLTLKELLAGFFQFYRDFDYKNVICPSAGHPVSTEVFKSPDNIPDDMHLYKEQLLKDPVNLKFKVDSWIKVQDPLQLNSNLTKNVPKKILNQFIAACNKSCKLIAERDERSLLGSLLSLN